MSVIERSDEKMRLGHDAMDETHKEMLDLLNAASDADKDEFPEAFARLVRHTEEHFANESKLMAASADPAQKEHEHQHAKLMREIAGLQRRVARGQLQFARAFIRERLPEWFSSHAASMVSMLAAYLKAHQPKKAAS